MTKKLKRYELKINPKSGAIVSAMSLVESPANESKFLAFGQHLVFAADDIQKELLGVAMIPDQVIYRRDEKTGAEYEVFFTAETIRQIAQQFMKNSFQNKMNINHSSLPAHSYIFQSYIVDSSKGITAPKGITAIDGSWIVGVKCEDDKVYKDIKEGKINGFSIEGDFLFNEVFSKIENENEQDIDAEFLSIINKIKEQIK